MERDVTLWPSIDAAYTDEFGQVDLEVYRAASAIWPHAERFAQATLGDCPTGLQLMMKAVTIVSRRRSESGSNIDNLSAYLAEVYKNLVLAELRKSNNRRQLENRWENELVLIQDSLAEDLDQKILIEQLCQRMDKWMREVFELRVMGYEFEAIGKFLGMAANHVRSRYSKGLARIRAQLNEEIRATAEKEPK